MSLNKANLSIRIYISSNYIFNSVFMSVEIPWTEDASYEVKLPAKRLKVTPAVELNIPFRRSWRYRMNLQEQALRHGERRELHRERFDINVGILGRLQNDPCYRRRMTDMAVTTSFSKAHAKIKEY